jgi:hypothetical protein
MAMFTNLKVTKIKALKEAILKDLGKINIICGKNNSGKSTLIEGINYPQNRSLGREFVPSDIDLICKKVSGFSSPASKPGKMPSEKLGQVYRQIVEENLIQKKKLWFQDDASLYADSVSAAFLRTTQWQVKEESIKKAFEEMFPEKVLTVLLPPKRQLKTITRIHTAEDITPIGDGILNHLFYAKNQSTGSPENEIYKKFNSAFVDISSGYKFDIVPDKINQLLLRFAFKNQSWIEANNCGLGLQDLMIICNRSGGKTDIQKEG